MHLNERRHTETPNQKTGRKDYISLDGSNTLRVSAGSSVCRNHQLYEFLYFGPLCARPRNRTATRKPVEFRRLKPCVRKKVARPEKF